MKSKKSKPLPSVPPQANALPQGSPLDAARAYWREIDQATKGGYLQGAELAIASDAWETYFHELDKAGRCLEIPHRPRPAIKPKITPYQLAQIAALLADKGHGNAARDLFPEAHELLIQAASYLKYSAQKPLMDFAGVDGVPFDQILASNQKDSASLKLLPGILGGKQSVKAERFKGLVGCIRRYYADDATCERFIAGKYLPIIELVKIRAWLFHERRRHGLAKHAMHEKHVKKKLVPKTGTPPRRQE